MLDHTAESMTLLNPVYLEGLNPEQRQAVLTPRNQPLKVLAGAGTGKTKLIAHRFVKLADELSQEGFEQPTERILSVTFTVKAAVEMQERIQQHMQTLGTIGSLSPEHWICNYHGFCLRILRQHAPLLGLSRNFTVLDGVNRDLVADALIEGMLAGEYTDIGSILEKFGLADDIPANSLSPAMLSQLPVEIPSSYLLRLPRILQQLKAAGLSPKSFYEAAMRQTTAWTERLKTLTVTDPLTHDILDSHLAYCKAWNRDFTDWRETSWRLMGTPADQERFHQKHWEKQLRKSSRTEKAPELSDDEDYYRDRIQWLYDEKAQNQKLYVDYAKRLTKNRSAHFMPGCLDFSELDALTQAEYRFIAVIAAFYTVYQETLRREGVCDFDDLINHATTLLATYPTLRRQYQNRFEAIIVDEFQDSNGAQLELLKLLSRDEGRNLTIVGDLKQSIYGFRYAQPENIDLVFGAQPVQTILLKTNYRSTPEIVSVANAMAVQITGDDHQRLNARSGVEGSAKTVTWVTFDGAAPDEEADAMTEEVLLEGMLNPSLEQKSVSIEVLKNQEADWIASEIEQLIQSGEYKAQDIMILAKNHRKAQILADALKKRNIPLAKQKSRDFFQQPLVKDILALFRLMIRLHDNAALTRLLQNKLNHRQIRQIARRAKARNISFFAVLEALSEPEATDTPLKPDLPPFVEEALISLATELSALKRIHHLLTPAQLLMRFSERIGLIPPDLPEEIQQEMKVSFRGFKQLLFQIQTNQSALNQPISLLQTLAQLDAYRQDPNAEIPVITEDPEDDAVSILTVHAAKGLEKPVVFVAYTELDRAAAQDARLIFDPQFPGKAGFGVMLGKQTGGWGPQADTLKKQAYQIIWRAPRLELEQKRLFYVAVTRAKERLYVCRAKKSVWWTDASQFSDCPIHAIKAF